MKNFQFDKNKRFEKLTKKEQASLTFDLVNAFVYCNNINEAASFLEDLLTRKEMRVLSKRLAIAKLLLSGMTYREIQDLLHVSHSTVAKIAVWLSEKGEGFRKIISKLPDQTNENAWKEYSEWDRVKRRYPLYFWPELLLEEIIKSANKRQKERIEEVLEKLDEKNELHKEIEKLLRLKSAAT